MSQEPTHPIEGQPSAQQEANPWMPGAGVPAVPSTAHAAPGAGPLGKVRGTGVCMLLAVVTLGIYTWVWWYKTHDEMKRHTGRGLGGTIALVLAIFIGVAMPFLTSNEVGEMYESQGQAKPVSALTGLWYFPGVFILVGPIVWFVKTNGALNGYWRALGAR
jgi:hypothetical protein